MTMVPACAQESQFILVSLCQNFLTTNKKMGKVKLKKPSHSAVRPDNQKIEFHFYRGEKFSDREMRIHGGFTDSDRLSQRRLAITPKEEACLKLKQEWAKTSVSLLRNDGLHLTKNQNKRARKRILAKKKIGALGNMESLTDALSAIEKADKSRSVKEKSRLSKSFKAQEMEMMKDIQFYRSTVQDPSFQADPFAAVAANIHRPMMEEQEDMS